MTYTITIANVGIISRVGRMTATDGMLIKFDGAAVSKLELNGKRYRPDAGGAFLVPTAELGSRNIGTAHVTDTVGEKEIILEEFSYNARDKRIKPLWSREIVAGYATIGALLEKVEALSDRVRELEQMVEPADNDLCI